MIATIVLIITLLLLLTVAAVVGRAILRKQQIIGRPPVPVVFFLLAKMLVLVNLTFLLLKGLRIPVPAIFTPNEIIGWIGVAFLVTGIIVLFLSVFALKKDLIFGLSSSGDHQLQTTGVYSISRHPFYLGFLFILFSSVLFIPNPFNIAAFLGAWLIHHFIMIEEESFLAGQYGEDYRRYAKQVNRYITFKRNKP